MARDTLTLALNGDIQLSDFREAMNAFDALVSALADEVASGEAIEWQIEALQASSAITSIRALAATEAAARAIERIVQGFEKVGAALQARQLIPFGKAVQDSATRIARMVRARVRSIRFETEEFDAEIFQDAVRSVSPATVEIIGLGAVQGRVESLTRRKGLRFTLYDMIDDRAVSCYLRPGMEDLMREAWGKLAIVSGRVRRDPITGRPTTIRNVEEVEILEEGRPGGYEDAFGALPLPKGGLMPEDAIRKIRDAG